MKQLVVAFATALALAGVSACGGESVGGERGAANDRSRTTASEAVGENTYFIPAYGLTVTAPDGWYVADSDLQVQLMDMGRDIVASELDAAQRAALNRSVQQSSVLFSFMEGPPGSPREYIANITSVAENVRIAPGVLRGSDYFFHVRQLLAQSPVPVVVSDIYSERVIGGKSFDRMDLEMGAPGQTISQRYYAARRGDEVIGFILSYRTDEELAVLDTVIDSITMN